MKDQSENGSVKISLPPVGIKILSQSLEGYEHINTYHGVSYCNAIFHATFGMEFIVTAESFKTCQWVPIVLGFKKAGNDFERSIHEHLAPLTSGIYIAPLHMFRSDIKPDVVIIRTNSQNIGKIIKFSGWKNFIDFKDKNLDLTALETFVSGAPNGISGWLVRNVNGLLDWLNRFRWWQSFTAKIFKSTFITKIFDKFITRYMANMSMCRNSTVIPYQTGKANASYFCTGGIAWGKNIAGNMTSGYPYNIFLKIKPYLDYPGKNKI